MRLLPEAVAEQGEDGAPRRRGAPAQAGGGGGGAGAAAAAAWVQANVPGPGILDIQCCCYTLLHCIDLVTIIAGQIFFEGGLCQGITANVASEIRIKGTIHGTILPWHNLIPSKSLVVAEIYPRN